MALFGLFAWFELIALRREVEANELPAAGHQLPAIIDHDVLGVVSHVRVAGDAVVAGRKSTLEK